VSAAKHTPGPDLPDVRTPDQERWLSGRLWAELRHGLYRDGRHAWDAPLTPERKPQRYVAVKCGRCNGKGAIASFSIRYSGKCFACDGSGVRYISRAAYAKRVAIAMATGSARAPEGFGVLPPAAFAAARAFGAGLDDRSLEQPSEVPA
jgi:hypothetical protein